MATEANLQHQSSRSTTCPAKLFTWIPPHLYSICYNGGCREPEHQASNSGRKKLPFHRKKPWTEQGSKGGTLLLVSGGGGGQKEERNRQNKQNSSLGCCRVTLAFSTVQWSELVPLSYKRSNSNVPKEAVITISATILYSITSTYKLVNSHPHTLQTVLYFACISIV